MGLVILLTKLADGMESPSASLAIVGGYGKGKVCILIVGGGYIYAAALDYLHDNAFAPSLILQSKRRESITLK